MVQAVSETAREIGISVAHKEEDAPSAQFLLCDLMFVSALASAFFQGYLRDHYGGIVSYGLTDGLFFVAFVLAVCTWGPRRFFARTPLTAPLLILALLGVPYMFNPESQIVEGILGFRAWNFYNLVFFYAYLRVDHDRAVHRVISLLLAIGVIVAVYGIYQFWIGPEKFVQGSRLIEARHTSEAYGIFTEEGVINIFRPFSTLNSAGNLGSTMVALSLLGLSFVLRTGRGRRWRVPIGVGILALYGMMLLLTGSRTSVIAYVMGIACVVALERRLSFVSLLVLLGGMAVYAAVVISGGAILGRLETLNPTAVTGMSGEINWRTVYLKRFEDNMGWVVGMLNNPIGYGLGTTGVGIPTLPGMDQWGFRGISVDSDLGRAAVEMGIPGFLVVGCLVGAMVVFAVRAGNRLRDGPYGSLGPPLAGVVVGFLPIIFLGNPLYGPPASLLIWSSMGALLKLEALALEPSTAMVPVGQPKAGPERSAG
jgi:O-antigen ligase